MNEIRTLLTLELRSLFGINKARYTRDKKKRNNYRLLIGAWVVIIAMVVFYVAALVFGLCVLGLDRIVPAYLTVIASVLILAFGIFTSGSRIFSNRGYDLLASMPLKPGSIVVSRFLAMYLEDFLLSIAILLPGTVIYGLCSRPGTDFYILSLVGALFVPAIPLVLATLCGTVVLAISSRMKSKSLAQTALMLALVLGVLAGSFQIGSLAEGVTAEAIADIARTAAEMFGKIYPPALWLSRGVLEGDLLRLGGFILASVAAVAALVAAVAGNFHALQCRLRSSSAGHNYTLGAQESRGLLKALLAREAKRYFSSSIYVTNTIIGPIMGCIMAIALWVAGPASLENALPGLDVTGVLPFVFGGVFCMMTTTSVSLSMEGRSFWTVKSLPIPTKTLLDSKLLLNLLLMLPFYLVSELALCIALKPKLPQLLWQLLIPASIMLFSAVIGITVNLKLHSFDWENEGTVVKQSMHAMLGGFAGPLLAAVLGFGVQLAPAQYGHLARGAACFAVLTVTVWLYRRNNRAVLSKIV